MKIKSLTHILTFIALPIGMLCISTGSNAQKITRDSTGTHQGFYYTFLKDTNGTASLTLGPAGHYAATWKDIVNFQAGIGWSNGSPTRVINFMGSFNPGSNGYLAVYGWTKSELIEYYIVENYGAWMPPGGISKGTFASDSGEYNIYLTYQRHGQPDNGINQAPIYWSVRTTKRSSGTVTFANHVAAWKEKGMNLGKIFDYQVMLSQGYQSSGSSAITLSEGGTVTDVVPDISPDDAINYMYYNSVRDMLYFTLPASQSPAEITLMSVTGAQTITWTTDNNQVKIDMAKYTAGIYLIKVISDGRTVLKKIIK